MSWSCKRLEKLSVASTMNSLNPCLTSWLEFFMLASADMDNPAKTMTLASGRQLVAEASAKYDVMLSEGCWTPLIQARNRAKSGESSIEDVCLCAVAECRNPAPIQDIPDYRHLLRTTPAVITKGGYVELMRFFVAVFQQMTKTPPEFDFGSKIRYCMPLGS